MHSMNDMWVTCDEQGQTVSSKGATKKDIYTKGLLHIVSHIWIWKADKNGCSVLLQKRSANKSTWPNLYDISAAGHVDLGETQLDTALRETEEEIGVKIDASKLKLINVFRAYLIAGEGFIENEFQWLYIYQLAPDTTFRLEADEVSSTEWKTLEDFKKETTDHQERYVPHGDLYFDIVTSYIEKEYQELIGKNS